MTRSTIVLVFVSSILEMGEITSRLPGAYFAK